MPKMTATPSGPPKKVANPAIAGTRLCAAVIAVSVLLAWANSFTAPFVLDDHPSIVANKSIRDLGSLDWLTPPATAGETVSGRPVLNFTFAVNHAMGGLSVKGYHLANVFIHMSAALALFGVVRRTAGRARPLGAPSGVVGASLADARGRSNSEPKLNSDGKPALLFASAVALVWALHPLHTGAVTYIVQRAESLCGLLVLLTLYCFIRGSGGGAVLQPALKRDKGRAEAPSNIVSPSASRIWFIAAFTCFLLAVGTKETAAAAPLVVLLYDRAFLSGSTRAALRARWRVYVALAVTWIPLVMLVLTNRGRGGSAGFGAEIDSWTYLLTQAGAIVRYLALAFWPAGLVFDYGTQTIAGVSEVWPQLLLLAASAVASVLALRKNRASGFLAACFFLFLAPSSSFVPVATQTIAEHRMYLPLAALAVLVCMGVHRGLLRIQLPRVATGVLVVTVAIALGAATFARNQVYRSELSLWEDTVARCPGNPRARNNFGLALAAEGRTAEAAAEFEQALALQPGHAFAHFNLAVLHTRQEAWNAAVVHYQAAIAADPGHVSAHINLGDVLARLGRTDEAVAHLQTALALEPAAHDARTGLASLMIQNGRIAEADALLRSVIDAAPEFAEAHYQLGRALEKAGAGASEIGAAYRNAVRLKPEMASAHLALGNILAAQGDMVGAERSCREAVRLDARSAEARFALGNIFAANGRYDAAMSEYRGALAIDPVHAGALNNLGNCQLVTRRFREAGATYEAVLRLRPDDETVKENLRLAREMERTAGPGRQ